MAVFCSRVVNLDPRLFVSERGVRYADGDLYFGPGALIIDPRLEYVQVPRNRPNVILVLFRQQHGKQRGVVLAQAAAAWLASLRDMSIACGWPDEQVDHARLVLRQIVFTVGSPEWAAATIFAREEGAR